MARKQRSLTPENLTDDQIVYHRPKAHTNDKRTFDGSQGSLLEKGGGGGGGGASRNGTLERQQIKISSRSSSSSSCSEAENELLGYRRSKQRSSGRSAGDNRIRRSR